MSTRSWFPSPAVTLIVGGALVLLSVGSAFAVNPLGGDAFTFPANPFGTDDALPPGAQGPFCLRVVQANPQRVITNLRLVVETDPSITLFFPILGAEFGIPAIPFFAFGFGAQLGQQVPFAIVSATFSVVKGRIEPGLRRLSGTLDVSTQRGQGTCSEPLSVPGGCAGDVPVTYELFPCP